jgi:Ethanolamine utilization protein EutJ (predicted chaperonin)
MELNKKFAERIDAGSGDDNQKLADDLAQIAEKAIEKAIKEIEARLDESLKDCARANQWGVIRYNGMVKDFANAIVIIDKHLPSLAQEWDNPTQD